MKHSQSHFLQADRPISKSSEDALGRKNFAYRLADQIKSWKGKDSLVIGLHGSWGSGKSSVKNLILERLSESGEKTPKIVPFDPWLISGEDRVATAFFTELGRALADDSLGGNAKHRAEIWKKYARYFETAAKFADATDFLIPLFGWIPGIGKWISTRLKKAASLATEAAEGLESKELSFEELRKKVKEQFEKLTEPLLIIIDDIDRLTSEEIRTIFRLVKANADFPNTVYLLLFQKETVAKALNPICNDQGEEFLKKIVQIELGLPHLTQRDVAVYWETGLNAILGPLVDPKEWSNERFVNVWAGGLSHYIVNLREAIRYLNSFSFMIGGLHNKGVLEVNPLDLLAIEAIRVFEPDIYGLLANNKSLLVDSVRDHRKDDLKELGKVILEKKRNTSEEPIKHLLSDLFPNFSSIWKNMGYGSEWKREWTRNRRVCTDQFFDRYFFLPLPDLALSEESIKGILSQVEDRSGLVSVFHQLAAQGILIDALVRLEAEDSLDTLTDPLPYLLALTDVSDGLPPTKTGYLTSLPGDMYVRRAVYRTLKSIENPTEKKNLVINLIRQSVAIYLPATWVDELEKPDENGVWPSAEPAEIEELKKEWCARVQKTSSEGVKLLEANQLARILQIWTLWGGEVQLKEWIKVACNSPTDSLILLKRFILASSSHSMGSAYIHDKSWLSWKTLERHGEQSFWIGVQDSLSKLDGLSTDQERTKRLFSEAMIRWNEGIEDDNPNKFQRD